MNLRHPSSRTCCEVKNISQRKGIFSRESLLGGILVLVPTCIWANPTGGAVAGGAATIAGQGTSSVIINQTSNTAIINWQSFSINSGESTSFLQPGANSAVLNRVLGGGTSLINGTLSANGQVYLVNGNGVIVGPGGVVNANAFTASTRDITDANFLAGKLQFTGSSDAGVQNLGAITALGGNVVLIGRSVDNEGTITAAKGTAGLIAGDDVLLAQNNADGSTITVSPATVTPRTSASVGVKNGGAITAAAAELKAANGNIYAMAVQNQGTIRATTVTHQGGRIWLTSDSGKVSNSGTLDASATAAGGHGGTVVVKSTTGLASHTGAIIAKGGTGGAGGNVDISGAQVQFSGTVDLTAPQGTLGNLLIDPSDVDIVTGGGTDITASTVDPSAIVTALNTADVTISATNSITVDDTVDASGNSNTGNLILQALTLNLNAGIVLNGALSGSASTVNVGPAGLVQNGVDAVGAGGLVNLAAGATYTLSNEVLINKDLMLEGNGAALNGLGGTRVMEIDGGTVTLQDLVLTGGDGVSTLGNGASFSGNGGALLIYGQNANANVSILNSTFAENSGNNGGAIAVVSISGGGMSLIIEDCTIALNNAVNGSAIYNDAAFGGSAPIGLKEDTITMNSGNGAIYSNVLSSGNAGVSINDTILAGNMNGGSESDYVNGGGATLNDGGYNLYGQNGDSGGFASTQVSDQLMFDAVGQELGPLGLYGGLTPTIPLTGTSLAFDNGDPAFTGALDQRGIVRGSPGSFTDTATDIGAFEAQVISLQADPVTVTYGDTPVLTYTVTSGSAASVATLIGSPMLIDPATNAGTYGEDIGQGSIIASPAYIVNFTNGDLTITPRPVSVLPDAGQSKVYGSPDPVLTYTATGLINGDTLTGSPSYSGSDGVAPVGNYPTTLGTLGDPTGNYSISLSSAAPTFAVTPATLYYSADQVMVPVGGTEFPPFTGTVVGFVNGETQESATTGSLFFTTEASPNSPQGFYEIDGGGLSANNYVFAQAATNVAALVIGSPMRGSSAPQTSSTQPTTPAETQTAASTPNTQTSQAIAQSSTSSTSSQPDPTSQSVPGGTSTPLVTNPAPPTVDINVTSISPNESIDSTPAPSSSGGGDAQTASAVTASAVASGSSFSPDIGATAVTTGQTVTVGGAANIPLPPAVQTQLATILGTGTQDSLSGALDALGTAASAPAADQTGTASTDATTPSTTTSSTQNTATTAAATGATGSFPNPAGLNAVGPVTVIASGQTLSISGGKAVPAGPPPPSVQAAFDNGFSSDSRDSLAQAAGLTH